MGCKKTGRSVAFTVRLPVRCVEIIDQLVYAGVYSSRGECIRDIVRAALREGFHKKMIPDKDTSSTPNLDERTMETRGRSSSSHSN